MVVELISTIMLKILIHYSCNPSCSEHCFRKSWLSILEIRINCDKSMVSLPNILYALLRSHGRFWANHVTVRPCRRNSSCIILPICTFPCSITGIKKSWTSFIRSWGSGIPVIQIRKPTIYSWAFLGFLLYYVMKFSRFQLLKEKRKRFNMSICQFRLDLCCWVGKRFRLLKRVWLFHCSDNIANDVIAADSIPLFLLFPLEWSPFLEDIGRFYPKDFAPVQFAAGCLLLLLGWSSCSLHSLSKSGVVSKNVLPL